MILYIIIFSLVIIIAFFMLKGLQNKIMFFPKRLEDDYDFNLQKHEKRIGYPIREYNIKGTNVIHLKNDKAKNFIIYAHGNSGHIGDYLNILGRFAPYASVLLFDYAGYGKSKGVTNTENVVKNMKDVWSYVTKELEVDPDNIILYGYSIGGAISSYLLHMLNKKNEKLPRAIILQSSFTSVMDMAKEILPSYMYYGSKLLIDNTFNSLKYLKKICDKVKIMVLHSLEDEIVSYEHAKKFIKNISCDHIVIDGRHGFFEPTEEFWNIFKTYL